MNTYLCNGKAAVKTISVMKSELLALIENGDNLTIDLSLLRRIDCSFAQLLIAANKEAKIKKLELKLSGICPEVKDQLVLCGIVHTEGK